MMTLRLEIEVIRPDGTTCYKKIQRVNSWTKQAAQVFESRFKEADVAGIKDISGVERTLDVDSTSTNKPLGLTDSTNTGIFLGTGATAADKDDNKLETKIDSGSGSGQLTHGTNVNFEGVLGTSTGYTVLTERTFTNDSGASITINEVGIQNRFDRAAGAGNTESTFLIVRDVLVTGVVVLDSEAIVVRYFTDWDV